MDKITITNGITTIEMPRTKKVTDAGAMEYVELTMAGGKTVREMIGFRAGFTYSWDYVPAAIINSLIALLRSGSYFTVDYFDIDGTEKSGVFSVSYPAFEVFTYKNGAPVWHNCSLTIKAQEVV